MKHSRVLKPVFLGLMLLMVIVLCYLYYSAIYPQIVEDANRTQAERVREAILRDCSLEIEVSPIDFNELLIWTGIYKYSNNRIINITCIIPPNKPEWACSCK